MITFTFLVVVAMLFVVLTVGVLLVGGATVLIAFGDFIICGLLIWFIVKQILKRKRVQ